MKLNNKSKIKSFLHIKTLLYVLPIFIVNNVEGRDYEDVIQCNCNTFVIDSIWRKIKAYDNYDLYSVTYEDKNKSVLEILCGFNIEEGFDSLIRKDTINNQSIIITRNYILKNEEQRIVLYVSIKELQIFLHVSPLISSEIYINELSKIINSSMK